MDFIWESITDWLKEILISGIVSNLSGMFDSTNEQVVCCQRQSGAVQRIVVGADTPENGVPEINTVTAETVCHAPVDNLICSQQIHSGVVGGRIAARNVAQLGVQELHAETMTIIHENASGVFGGQLWQATGEAVLRGDHGIDSIPISDGTGFNAFRNERAHIMGAGMFLPRYSVQSLQSTSSFL